MPINGPAIGNLMTLFDFNRTRGEIAAEREALVHMSARYTMAPFAHAKVTAPDSDDLD